MKKVKIFLAVVAATALLTMSCHRKSGCPGFSSDKNKIEKQEKSV
ncbi:MAG: hypothetical protein R2801_01735 [Chitinophagales bacterium]